MTEELKKEIETLRAEIQKSLSERDSRMTELEAKIKAEEEGPPEDVPPPEIEGPMEPDMGDISGKIDTLASAITALAPGTPEAIEEAVSLAESVKEESGNLEMMKEKFPKSKEVIKAIERLSNLRKALVQVLSKPMTKSRGKADESRVQKAQDIASREFAECEKAHNEGRGKEWWSKHGITKPRI